MTVETLPAQNNIGVSPSQDSSPAAMAEEKRYVNLSERSELTAAMVKESNGIKPLKTQD